MNIIIAPDSYKGCLTSKDVALNIAGGISIVSEDIETIRMPASDGGDGLLSALGCNLNIEYVTVKCHDALLRPISSQIGIIEDTAIIESAQANGIDLIKESERDIMHATSYGVGELIIAALDYNCKKIIIGLGGSATNDAGIGMMRALGMRVEEGNYDVSLTDKRLQHIEIIAACDVSNPLLGQTGATMVYGRQKGASDQQLKLLEERIAKYSKQVFEIVKYDYSTYPGAGAAGGIAFSLMALCGAKMYSGAQIWMELSNFKERIKYADLVLTGEGKSDKQTLMGKLPYQILQECKKQCVPCVLISGRIESRDTLLNAGFDDAISVSPSRMPIDIVIQPDVARDNIRHATAQYIKNAL